MLKSRTAFLAIVFLFLTSTTAFAGFVFEIDHDEHGQKLGTYFSFGHWSAWEQAGGYLDVAFRPEGTSEIKTFTIPASQKKYYMEYNGTWTFYPKFANGEQAGSVQFRQTVITDGKKYNGEFDNGSGGDGGNGGDNGSGGDGGNGGDNGSGGDGGSGGDNGSGGDGGNGGDNGSGGDGGSGGSGCGCFQTEEWKEMVSTLKGIMGKIPPPPNWHEAAQVFDNTIRPNLINDLANLLGEAPSPPSPPPLLELDEPSKPGGQVIIDYADKLNKKEPVMQEVPGLNESGYTKQDIENAAPVIEFRDDPTGGFNIGNPLDSIPKVESPPVPGQPASDWMEIPSAPQQQTPPTPSGGGNVDVTSPPTPNTNAGTPPVPGGNNGSAPTPGNNGPAPPTPGHNTPEPGNYKRHPEHADGSG